jgi:glucose-1-phosphate adenylyltransferase
MNGADIGRRARVHKALLCPGVMIPDGATVGLDADADRERFIVTEQGVTVIPGGFEW